MTQYVDRWTVTCEECGHLGYYKTRERSLEARAKHRRENRGHYVSRYQKRVPEEQVREYPWRDASALRERYERDRLTIREIAAEMGARPETVRKWLHRFGINVRNHDENVALRKQRGNYGRF